jgi:hypothetical protein
VVGVDLQLDGAAPSLRPLSDGLPEKRPADAAPPMRWNDEELVQPGNQTAMLERPRIRQHCHAERCRIMGEEHRASRWLIDEETNGFAKLAIFESDSVLLELRAE